MGEHSCRWIVILRQVFQLNLTTTASGSGFDDSPPPPPHSSENMCLFFSQAIIFFSFSPQAWRETQALEVSSFPIIPAYWKILRISINQGCAPRKIAGSPRAPNYEIWSVQHLSVVQKSEFSSHLMTKVGAWGSRAQSSHSSSKSSQFKHSPIDSFNEWIIWNLNLSVNFKNAFLSNMRRSILKSKFSFWSQPNNLK